MSAPAPAPAVSSIHGVEDSGGGLDARDEGRGDGEDIRECARKEDAIVGGCVWIVARGLLQWRG